MEEWPEPWEDRALVGEDLEEGPAVRLVEEVARAQEVMTRSLESEGSSPAMMTKVLALGELEVESSVEGGPVELRAVM